MTSTTQLLPLQLQNRFCPSSSASEVSHVSLFISRIARLAVTLRWHFAVRSARWNSLWQGKEKRLSSSGRGLRWAVGAEWADKRRRDKRNVTEDNRRTRVTEADMRMKRNGKETDRCYPSLLPYTHYSHMTRCQKLTKKCTACILLTFAKTSAMPRFLTKNEINLEFLLIK